jgi:hypothetical protein
VAGERERPQRQRPLAASPAPVAPPRGDALALDLAAGEPLREGEADLRLLVEREREGRADRRATGPREAGEPASFSPDPMRLGWIGDRRRSTAACTASAARSAWGRPRRESQLLRSVGTAGTVRTWARLAQVAARRASVEWVNGSPEPNPAPDWPSRRRLTYVRGRSASSPFCGCSARSETVLLARSCSGLARPARDREACNAVVPAGAHAEGAAQR